MFYRLSKALAFVADPAGWSVAILIAAVLVARWRFKVGLALVAFAAAISLTLSSPAVALGLRRAVERSAPNTFRPGHRYDAAVVLGGDFARVDGGAEVVLSGASDRLFHTGALTAPELERLLDDLVTLGIPAHDVVVGLHARNTWENAVETAQEMSRRGWRSIVVVTSAVHAPRAAACFRRLGVAADVLPVEYTPRPRGTWAWVPSREGLWQSRVVLHEVIGRVVYELVGYAG